MPTIDKIIAELAKIPGVLQQSKSDPRQQPQPRRGTPTGPAPVPVRVNGDPVVDAERWHVADHDLWEEVKHWKQREVEGDGPLSPGPGGSSNGIDALAWYVSFHSDQRAWGIYVRLSSLAVMDDIYLSGLRADRERRLHLAWSALVLHERMHFAVDYACAWLELMLRAPARREFVERFQSPPEVPGLNVSEAYLEIEETAANAYMLRELPHTETQRAVRVVEQFVRRQPPGYREGLAAVPDAAFARAVAETLRSYFALWAIEHRLDLGNEAMNLLHLLPVEDEGIMSACPVYEIDDLENVGIAPGSVRLIQRIPEVLEVDGFEKQFRRQDSAVQRDWIRVKEQIKFHVPPPPRFEKLKDWKPPTWSLRLRSGYRVHLLPPDAGTSAWRAIGIGSHKEMGHE